MNPRGKTEIEIDGKKIPVVLSMQQLADIEDACGAAITMLNDCYKATIKTSSIWKTLKIACPGKFTDEQLMGIPYSEGILAVAEIVGVILKGRIENLPPKPSGEGEAQTPSE